MSKLASTAPDHAAPGIVLFQITGLAPKPLLRLAGFPPSSGSIWRPSGFPGAAPEYLDRDGGA